MPLYEYQCQLCNNNFEEIFPLKQWNIKPDCPICGGRSKKLLTLGGIQDDHPVWLDNSVRDQLQDTDNPNIRPITTRTEYNNYLKDNGIQPTG